MASLHGCLLAYGANCQVMTNRVYNLDSWMKLNVISMCCYWYAMDVPCALLVGVLEMLICSVKHLWVFWEIQYNVCPMCSRNECMRVLLKCCWVHLINMFSWWVSFLKKTYILVHDNFAVTFLPSKQHILTVLSAGNAASEFRDCYPALLSCQKLPSASHDYKGPMRSIIVQSKTANRFFF